MGFLFEMDNHRQVALYTEGNEIMGVRFPLRRGGEFTLRTGYLSDFTAVLFQGMVRFAWHSLEHHIILSGTEEQSDRIILSDPINAQMYGGLRLLVKEEELWIFYTGKEPGEKGWHGYIKKLEPSEEEPTELPGVYDARPSLQMFQIGKKEYLLFGDRQKESLYEWKEGTVTKWESDQEKMKELEAQITYAREQYEELRQIALKLQEDGRKMRDYIKSSKKDRHP